MSCDSEPIWLDDSVSPCFSRLYLQAWPSFLAVSISATLLAFYRGEESLKKQNKLRVRRLVESALVILQLALIAAGWTLTNGYQGGRRQGLVFWSSASFWTYALVLITARYVNNRDNTVWAHSAGLYSVAAVIGSIALKTAFDTESPLSIYIAQVSFSMLLFILTWSDYDGDERPDIALPDESTNVMPNDELAASLFSRASFSYMDAMLWRGKAKPLEIEDVNDLNPDLHASDIYKRFQSMSARYPDYSFVARLLIFNRSRILIGLLLGAVHAVLEFGPTIMIKFILDYLEDPEKSSSKLAWTCVSGIFIVSLFENVFNLQSLANGKAMSITTQDVITTKIYQKSLNRKVAATGTKKQGTIINLMSVDAGKIVEVWRYYHFFISAVFELVCETIILWKLLGWPAVVGSVAGLVWTPMDYYMASWHAKLQDQFMEAADERVERTNEVLQCIRIIKYFAWEDKFSEKVREARTNELKALGKQIWIDAIGVMVWLMTPMFISGTAFGWYTLVEKRELTNSIAFTSISLFTLLHEPLTYMVDTVTAMMDARVSLRRLSEFFDEPETGKYNQLVNDGKIGFNDASFEWDNKPDSFKLRELDVKFPRGKMTVITGSTGSGKTSLLLALLGEMDLITGTVHLPNKPQHTDENGLHDTVAYCAQQAWLLNDTLKSNILFGSEYDAARYNSVIEACALRQDIQMLENGDSTLVGERGVILSGGQKQRISLARAIYSFSKNLLLDDCLSAVDSHTALKIYDDCLTGDLVANRTVILVSHNVQLALSKAHWVVQVEDGRIKYEGKPDLSAFAPPSQAPSIAGSETGQKEEDAKDEADSDDDSEDDNDEGDGGKYDETKATGSVSKRLYGAYFKKLGGVSFTIKLILLFALEQSAEKYKTAWLRTWSLGSRSNEFYLILYVILSMSNVFIAGIEQVYLLYQGLAASRKIYNDLLDSVLGTSIRFFDTTPVGRIINRFSKDMESIDQDLPDMGRGVADLLATIGSSALLIAWITPPFAAVLVVISGVYAAICSLYLSSSRELKRLGSVTKSPILQQFGETLLGVATIRAYGHSTRFMDDNMSKTDTHMRPTWYIACVNRWLQFRIQIANAVITSGAAAFVVLSVGKLDAGFAGLSLSYAMSINQLVMYLISNYADLENQMTSVERTEEYSHLPSERFNGVQPAPSWPQAGGVNFEHVSIRYAPELPVVINDLSFDIPAGSKLGVVGRTGAGKSTIITALFRLVEAEKGVITIDGNDISKLELKAVRRALAIIPQDPTLFAGTLRSNLDPFDLYSDEEILESLRRVHLISEQESGDDAQSSSSTTSENNQNVNQFKNLESEISEGGSNISQGQRQLVCLARSLLKRCKILLLDEATASIDYETDKKIQQTIREEFKDTTLITIAHRLHSIIDYDSILVLDKGEKVEFGTPKQLFDDKTGIFRSMCDKGDVTEKDF